MKTTTYDGNFLPSMEAAVIRAETNKTDSKLRRESLEDAYQITQRLRFESPAWPDGFDMLIRVESRLLNELLREMSCTREFAASA